MYGRPYFFIWAVRHDAGGKKTIKIFLKECMAGHVYVEPLAVVILLLQRPLYTED